MSTYDHHLAELARRLRTRRQELELSTRELAAQCGWASDTTIKRYERGERIPSLENLYTLASALETTVHDLVPVE